MHITMFDTLQCKVFFKVGNFPRLRRDLSEPFLIWTYCCERDLQKRRRETDRCEGDFSKTAALQLKGEGSLMGYPRLYARMCAHHMR